MLDNIRSLRGIYGVGVLGVVLSVPLATPRILHAQGSGLTGDGGANATEQGTNGTSKAPSSRAAPAAPEEQLEEVVVTAQKREQRLQDVGISITALSGSALKSLQPVESIDVIAQVPNVQNASTFGPGTNPNLSIRGIALNDYNDGSEAPVAVYVDELYLVPLGAGSFPTYDLNRVEVLRGPQGTLFGRNTTGGILHYISNRPELGSTFGSVEYDYGSYATNHVTGFINAALSDNFAIRASGDFHSNNGWAKNLYGQADAGALRTHAARIQGLYKEGVVTADVKFEYSNASGASTTYHPIFIGEDGLTVNKANGLIYGGSVGYTPYRFATNSSPNFLKDANSYIGLAKVDFDLDAVQLTSITGYNHYNRDTIEDCDGSAKNICNNFYDFRSYQISEETRLSGKAGAATWIAGLYYLHESGLGHNTAPLFVSSAGIPAVVLDAQYNQHINSYAVFGNIDYQLTSEWSVIFGTRFTQDDKKFNEVLRYSTTDTNYFSVWPNQGHDFNIVDTSALYDFSSTTAGAYTNLDKSSVAVKTELDFKPSRDTLIYASLDRGAKAGGFNNGYITLGTPYSQIPYRPETIYSVESGVKLEAFDHRLRVNAAAFWYHDLNFQTLTFTGIGSEIGNNDARAYGAEFEVSALPVPAVTLSLGTGLLNTRVKGVVTSTGYVETSQMILAPHWSVNGLVKYEIPVGDSKLALQSDFKATASYFADIQNNPALEIPSYAVGNARITYISAGDRYEIGVFVKNIADDHYRVQAFNLVSNFGLIYQELAPPRWFGVSATLNF